MSSSPRYLRPGDVPEADAKNVLNFLNSATTIQEIADGVEFPNERDVGRKLAQNILEERARIGKFRSLDQVFAVPQVGPERFTEIVVALKGKEVSEILRDPIIKALPPNLRKSILELRKHESSILKTLNENPEIANLFLRDPGGALSKMKIPIDPQLRKRTKMGGLDDFIKPREFCLPNGKTLRPKIRVRFVPERG